MWGGGEGGRGGRGGDAIKFDGGEGQRLGGNDGGGGRGRGRVIEKFQSTLIYINLH